MSDERFGTVLITVLGVALFGLLGWQIVKPREPLVDAPFPSAAAASPTPTAVADATTAPPTTAPPATTAPPPTTAPPTPTTPPPTEAPLGQTVLFRGGPATGPWQQIGTVAEVTHPDAPATARRFYTENWSDPTEENMPASLWDICVAQVTEQAVLLGPPLERPAWDRSPQSIPFNASGGFQSADYDKRLLVAGWAVFYERPDGVAVWAHFPYLITFEGTILERGEVLEAVETDYATDDEAGDAVTQWYVDWSDPLIEAWEGHGG